VKIRHVRGFKRQLILESQNSLAGTAPVAVASAKTVASTPVVRPSSAS
jgi:hypothetical protein